VLEIELQESEAPLAVRQPILLRRRPTNASLRRLPTEASAAGIRRLRWACLPDPVPGTLASPRIYQFCISEGPFKRIRVEILRENNKDSHPILIWRALPVC